MIFILLTNPAFAGYSYYRTITVDHTKVPNTDQTQFPILVCGNGSSPCGSSLSGLNQSGGGAHVTNSSGFDIIFTTDSACSTKLTWEMEKYVASTGEFEAWVTNTSTALSHTADTVFYMCYGNAAISTFQSTATAVWDSNFIAVYHFKDGTTLSGADSTSNGYTLTLNSSPTATSGQIDGAGSFTGAATADGTDSIPMTGSPVTISFWINRTSNQNFAAIVAKGDSNNTTTHDWSATANGTTGQIYMIRNGGNVVHSTTALTNAWTYFSGSMNTTATNMYFNGTADASGTQGGTGTGNTTNTSGRHIHVMSDTTQFYTGLIDEVRVSTSIRSADWVSTDYNNQSNPNNGTGQFYSMGTETSAGGNILPTFDSINNATLNNATIN